jgi:hypothetical protein
MGTKCYTGPWNSVSGVCERSNERSGSIKDRTFLEHLSSSQEGLLSTE